MEKQRIRLIAFLLPQFHPIPENDKWWGSGFTEWTNVRKAKPLFPGHYQPHVPGELGYYDLRDPSVREAQAALAIEYGIHGFCYYHYWFNGKPILELPFDEVLNSGRPDFPFCLCWANENWTRAWDGKEKEVLVEQRYSDEDDRSHAQWLSRAFKDKRYIKINGKPLFLVYRAKKIPDPLRATAIFREEARKAGIGEIFICRVESFYEEQGDPSGMGFDAAVQFQPNARNFPAKSKALILLYKIVDLLNRSRVPRPNDVIEYGEYVKRAMRLPEPLYKSFFCVMPGWDNSPRRPDGARIFKDSTPDMYGKWLRAVLKKAMLRSEGEEKVVFINAWNEWGEGNHLEPCQKWERAYLEETRKASTSP